MATATTSPGDRVAAAPRIERHLSTETKSATKTTEFYAYVATTVGVLLAGLLTKVGDGHDDRLTAQDTWLIVGILTVGYMISRGLAKSGSKYHGEEDSLHRDAR